MIRFMPDTWRDALLRPIAMAAPDGGVYVETVAPDFRFVFVLLLLLLVVVLRHRRPTGRAAFTLLAFCAIAFVPWLATTGNGRYFTPVLLLAGPLCVALLWLLPFTRALRLTLLAGMIGLQLFLVHQNAPWDSWGLVPWKEGDAFAVDVPDDLRSNPVTYITMSSISYSIIAPRFHPASRWVNLTTQRGGDDDRLDGRRTKAFLAAAGEMHLLFPSLPGEGGGSRPPTELVSALDDLLGAHGLQIQASRPCRFLRSPGLTGMGTRRADPPITAPDAQRGFWLCAVARLPEGARQKRQQFAPEVEAVFDKVERTCPRLFAPGSAGTTLLPAGARRYYVNSDMRLYVLNEGRVMYKYMRALNAVSLGRVEDVLASGFRMDCDNVRGRTGLPWEREI